MSGKPLTKATSDLVRVVGIDDNHHENIEITNINSHGNTTTSNQTSCDNIRALKKENHLFLRAALQLLEENEVLKGTNYEKKDDSSVDLDVIRFGRLKKAARGGASSFSAIAPLWKWKYVELRHGSFIYEDDTSSMNVPFLRNKTANSSKKVINLSITAVSCRPFKIRTTQGDCVFELTLFGGARRLFMASSVLERDAWVSAIKIAMTGTLDFLSDNYIKPVKFAAFLSTAIKGSQYTVANAYRLLQQGAGAAAPYAEEIARFTSLQVAAQTTSTTDGLKEILQKMQVHGIRVTIPVFYIKSKCKETTKFTITRSDVLNKSTAVNQSQAWKDMQRDTVNINGHLVSGGVGGAEVIVGYLVRQIMEKAEILNNNKGSNPSSANNSAHNAADILNCSGDKLASVISSDNISLSDQMSSIQLTESQILAFARDLLVLCNRTQSGGDTYFCVDSMLINHDKNLCILVPSTTESDPLEVTVSIADCRTLIDDSTNNTTTSVTSEIAGAITRKHRSISMHLQSGLSALLAASRGESSPSPTISIEKTAVTYPSIDLNGGSSNTLPVSDETTRENGSHENHNVVPDNSNVWEESSIISDVTLDSVLLKTSVGTNRKGGVVSKGVFPKSFNLTRNSSKSMLSTNSDEASSDVDDDVDYKLVDTSGKMKGRSNSYSADNDTTPNSKATAILASNEPFPSTFTPTYQCIQVQVKANSKYKLCNSNPQGNEDDTLAYISATFQQTFYLKSNRPVMSDRLVTIEVQE